MTMGTIFEGDNGSLEVLRGAIIKQEKGECFRFSEALTNCVEMIDVDYNGISKTMR